MNARKKYKSMIIVNAKTFLIKSVKLINVFLFSQFYFVILWKIYYYLLFLGIIFFTVACYIRAQKIFVDDEEKKELEMK